MVASEVRAFVRANLPAPHARVLEVGGGDGELAGALTHAVFAADESELSFAGKRD
jgi:16S rRNA A1518/A1519 N6-dimethyltransferase RsmA/KsgA/DIM1 with predicted DNA glycosylase/AP lyase activity